jgi:hypothetical protein
MQSAKGLEHWAWSQGCGLKNVFSLAKKRLQSRIAAQGIISGLNEDETDARNERQLSNFHSC